MGLAAEVDLFFFLCCLCVSHGHELATVGKEEMGSTEKKKGGGK